MQWSGRGAVGNAHCHWPARSRHPSSRQHPRLRCAAQRGNLIMADTSAPDREAKRARVQKKDRWNTRRKKTPGRRDGRARVQKIPDGKHREKKPPGLETSGTINSHWTPARRRPGSTQDSQVRRRASSHGTGARSPRPGSGARELLLKRRPAARGRRKTWRKSRPCGQRPRPNYSCNGPSVRASRDAKTISASCTAVLLQPMPCGQHSRPNCTVGTWPQERGTRAPSPKAQGPMERPKTKHIPRWKARARRTQGLFLTLVPAVTARARSPVTKACRPRDPDRAMS